MQSPMTNIGTNMACEKAWAGWPCDAEAEKLRGAVVDAPDDASRKLALEACTAPGRNAALSRARPVRPALCQARQCLGRAGAPVMLFWNIEKNIERRGDL
jgi:peptide/nickel transport system substrate-binding protein